MEWIQVFTIIASTLGGIYVFYQITKEHINRLDKAIECINSNHRADMQLMDEKWERLFERLLLQDKKQ